MFNKARDGYNQPKLQQAPLSDQTQPDRRRWTPLQVLPVFVFLYTNDRMCKYPCGYGCVIIDPKDN